MFRSLIISVLLLLVIAQVQAQAQTQNDFKNRGIFKYNLPIKKSNGIAPLDSANQDFIAPGDSLLKLQRQVDLQLFPAGFYPSVETETDAFKLKALRYGVAYYRDSEVPGLAGFYDVMLPIRLDTRNGALDVKYYHVATIINTQRVQFVEERSSLALLTNTEGSAMIYVVENGQQELVSFEGLFTEEAHAVNFIAASEVVGIKSDFNLGKFAIFVRGGSERASLFVLNSDSTLRDVQSTELIHDLLSTDQAYIFELLPALVPTFRSGSASASR